MDLISHSAVILFSLALDSILYNITNSAFLHSLQHVCKSSYSSISCGTSWLHSAAKRQNISAGEGSGSQHKHILLVHTGKGVKIYSFNQ